MPRGVFLKLEDVTAALRSCRGLIYLAAKKLNVTRQAVHYFMNRHPELKEIVEEERGRFVDAAELALIAAVQKGQPWAVCFALKTQGRQRGYVERQEIEQAGRIHVTTSAGDLTDDELASIATRSSKKANGEKKSTEIPD